MMNLLSIFRKNTFYRYNYDQIPWKLYVNQAHEIQAPAQTYRKPQMQ